MYKPRTHNTEALKGEPDLEGLEHHYLEALKLAPKDPSLLYQLGILYEDFFDDISRAIACYEKAIACDPDYVDAYVALCELGIQEGGNDEAALTYARQVLKLEPLHDRNLNNLGCLLARAHKDYEGAAGFFEQSLSLYPDNAITLANLADAYIQLGRHEEAADCYEEALQLDPGNALYHYHYGQVLRLYFQDFEEAEACYKKSIRLDPKNLAPYRALRSMYTFDLHDDEKGVEALEAAAGHFSEDASLLMEIAGIYDYQLGDFQKARDYYEKVVALHPGHLLAWSALGIVCGEMLKDYEGGMDAYTQVLKLDPDHVHANLNMGHLYFYHFKEFELALSYYKKALALIEGTSEEQVYGGEIYLSLGIFAEQYQKDKERAIDYYERALEFSQEDLARRRLLALYGEELRVH